MDLKRLDTICLGVTHGGVVDKPTFQQIASLARRFLVEEREVIDLGKQIEMALSTMRTLAEDLVKDNGISSRAAEMVERLQKKLQAQVTQRAEWMSTANRQQSLIDRMLTDLSELIKLIRPHLDTPTEETARALRDYLSTISL